MRFGSVSAKRGWSDLVATQRNAVVEMWEFLTHSPCEITPTNYPLKGELAAITRDGTAHQRWQHKPTLRGSARVWFYVAGQVVVLEQVHTAHPAATR